MPKITFDSDEELIFDEDLDSTTPIEAIHDTSDVDSDDDAMPEAVSTKSSRDQAASAAKAQKEAALKLAKADKEKRRLRDLQLKQQKQGSRRELKKQKQQQQPTSDSDHRNSSSDESDNDEEDVDEQLEDGQRLPQDILDAWSEATPAAGSKRTHMTMADFEAVQAEYEAEVERKLAAQRKKQKKVEQGHKVGEYTVKVLNQRPKVAKSGSRLRNMIDSKLHRKSNERENAIIQRSAGRFGSSALVFRRPEPAKNGKK